MGTWGIELLKLRHRHSQVEITFLPINNTELLLPERLSYAANRQLNYFIPRGRQFSIP